MADKQIADIDLLDAQPADTDLFEIERPGVPGTPYRVRYSRVKMTGAQVKAAYEAEADTNAFTDAEAAKLAGIAAGAEVNPDVVPQAEAEAGAATTERIWTAQRVAQAIAAQADATGAAAAAYAAAAGDLAAHEADVTTHGITAAAATVLDDATVAAMVDTLGGAAATGTGGLVRATSPTLVTPALGTPASGVLTNCTGLPIAGGGTGAATAAAARVALLPSLTGNAGDVLAVNGGETDVEWVAPSAGSSPPFSDADPLVENASDGSKELRISAANIAAATTRVLTMANANVDLGEIYLFRSYYETESGLNADGQSARGVAVRLPCNMTITAVKFSGPAISGDDVNYWTMDVKYLSSAGGGFGAGTSLCSAPSTTKATGGNAALPFVAGELVDLGANQNLSRNKDDLIYLVFTKTASPQTLANVGITLVVEGTRRA